MDPERPQGVPRPVHLGQQLAVGDPVVARVERDPVAPALLEIAVEKRGRDVEVFGNVGGRDHRPRFRGLRLTLLSDRSGRAQGIARGAMGRG